MKEIEVRFSTLLAVAWLICWFIAIWESSHRIEWILTGIFCLILSYLILMREE